MDTTARVEQPDRLKSNVLTAPHLVVVAMAATGPAAVAALNYGPMAAFAGPAFVLSFVLVLPAILLLANSMMIFSRRYRSAGSLYTWSTRAFGTDFGFLFGWLFVGSYIILAAAGFAVFGGWGESWAQTSLGATIPWWIWSSLAVALVAALSYRGIHASVVGMGAFLAFELTVLTLLSLWMLVGGEGLTVQPFTVSAEGVSWAGVGLAMTFGVLSCVGIEETTTLAEETKSRRTIAIGVLAAAIIIPLFYVFTSYALTVGLGLETITGLAPDSAPLQDAASQYWGAGVGLSVVVVAVLFSILTFAQAGFNAGVRVMYALGREGLLPRTFGRTHRRFQTPHVAVIGLFVIVTLLGWPLAAAVGPFNVWAYFGFMISIMFLIIYVFVNLALTVDTWRSYRHEFNAWRHGVFPIVGALFMLYPLYRVVWPLPEAPFPAIAALVVAWIVVGIVLLLVLRSVNPAAVARAGMVMGELTDESDEPLIDPEPPGRRRPETGRDRV